MRLNAQPASAAAPTTADSTSAARAAAHDAAPSASTVADAEDQLLAWLSGTTSLQTSTAGSSDSGPAKAEQITTSPLAAGPIIAGPTGMAAAVAAIAANVDQGTLESAARGGSSDDARTDSLSSDPSPSVSALISANALPAHLAGILHAGAAHQPVAVLQAPLGTSAWVEELGTQLSWMSNRGIESASLHVSPAELGPIEVRIAMHGTDASIWFGAAQAQTRTALEQALPQLRQLLASHGLALADAGVFREPPRGSAQQPPPRSVAPIEALSEEPSRTRDTATAAVRLGLLDLYA